MNLSAPAPIRIATRTSNLALWQAEHIAGLIRAVDPRAIVEIVHVTTAGDRDQSGALQSFGGVGVFTREVQRALLDGRADLAVHSLKDLPTQPAAGLCIAAIPAREDTADALVLPAGASSIDGLKSLAIGAVVGTGSLRRQAQLRHVRRDLKLREIRGNVETRLQKLDAGEYDAIILAAAGLIRLQLAGRISARLTPPVMYAAVGQGALAVECRDDDAALRSFLEAIDDTSARAGVTAERALLARLDAGCHAPVGTSTQLAESRLMLEAVVLSPDGLERLHGRATAAPDDACTLGRELAETLLRQGAARWITQPSNPK